MERTIRANAGVPAAHFSQDDSLYLRKRQRPVYFDACLRCQVVHRSEKEQERCRRADAAEKRLNEVCPRCQVAHRSEKKRERCRRADAADQCRVEKALRVNAANNCQFCGGSHK